LASRRLARVRYATIADVLLRGSETTFQQDRPTIALLGVAEERGDMWVAGTLPPARPLEAQQLFDRKEPSP
jgi:hypothetical protein